MPKYDGIDIMALYTSGNTRAWNKVLTTHYNNRDINGLAVLRYRLQVGMSNLAKQKLNTDAMNVWYIRLLKSIEKTAKKIIAIKNPMPGDNYIAPDKSMKAIELKKKRDEELTQFLIRSAY